MESLSMASLASAGSMAGSESTRANSSRDGSDFCQKQPPICHVMLAFWYKLIWLFETDLLFW
ncbi:hypothetical protein SADUNF_Sadunf13G0058200 [Salix dunnii]|uniref:Uncharacterized protein n=1 Tax=Salix dunnii TaxID=1413687 RepID=A0A835MLS3_9ROSI|nr:hypothetical protein SADUNF_Sadunf13G0058200 [Salix dunnii]